ncbi:MAG TPA: chemotaxis protein CheB [Candidatus Sulfotelmatobacter sp.]|jgi:two-component system CheB/CheR fusion protein|nr:chemotaxis protein CheB [Candidatus Sulfotelmatobacter sp.]
MKSSPRKQVKSRRKAAPEDDAKPSSGLFPIVGIGASAGGLEAFSELLRHLPEKTGMAFVLVQHLDPKHGSVLQEILSRTTKIPVTEVTQGVVVQPNHAYVIPANTNLTLKNGMLQLGSRVLTRGQHMPINDFFRSLAENAGQQAIGVILSGTASDGTEGCRAIKAAGGITFAQDEESAKYDSMPRNAVNAGCIDFILSPKDIARELGGISQHPYVARVVSEVEGSEGMVGSDLNALFGLLRESTGVDFTNYKHTTLQRRIRRRMVVHKVDKLKDYLRFIGKKPEELDELYRDLLIHVTGFFREPEAFVALRKHVYPKLFEGRKPDNPIRVWVAGCSTGEEVYSIAITLLEYMWVHSRNISQAATAIQIFATDISDTALDRARTGLYTEAAVSEISADRLKRFFIRLDGGFQVNKSIRDMCIFAKQNLVKDPPFSNLDLVSCRNLLIYLGPVLQRRVIPTLHYSLKPGGYLVLGSAENLGGFADHFGLVDKKDKIYQKRRTAARLTTYFANSDYLPIRADAKQPRELPAPFTVEREVEHLLVNRFVPASIVVNDQLEIVQFHGKTGAYLEPPAGQPSFSLAKMAREGLLIDLRAALNTAKKTNATVRKQGVRIQSETGTREVNLEVVPLRGPTAHERFYVVVFQDEARKSAGLEDKGRTGKTAKVARSTARDTEILKREMNQLREQLRSLIEEHETTTEEFKSAHEEVLSANEELQSTNEELETAKEELQSTNEELTTLNEEMQNRNSELGSANNDLLNLLGHVDIPVVMVSNDLRIRRFTPPAQKLLNLLPGDIGRRLGEIRPNLDVEDLESLAHEAIRRVTPQERQVRTKEGGWQVLHVRPYKTWDNRIEGAVISLQDVDSLKRSLDQTREYADTIVETAREPILVLNSSLQVTAANPAFYRTFDVSREETEKRLIYELGNGQWNIPGLRELLEEIVPRNCRVDDFEMSHDFPRLGTRDMLLNARRVELQPGHPFILLAIEDVTEKRREGAA